ncbi:MAG: hypothetical protein KF845_03305 [Cyclobacteriaceae bacterium]|nr:hypothetical protein [Cyclobacteriaceae bacterium]
MKKSIVFVLFASLLMAFDCSNDSPSRDCGCDSKTVVRFLNEAKGTVWSSSALGAYFNIYLDEVEPNAGHFRMVTTCNSLLLGTGDLQEGTRVRISGEVKGICSEPHIKIGSSPVVIKEIEVIPVTE